MISRSLRALAPGVAALLVLGAGSPVGAQDPTMAPPATLSADGRSVTAGGRTLSASQTSGLAPEGQAVTVTGSGYDEHKGVYVGLCVVPPTNHAPSPCGGGQDRSGTGGVSAWIASNPPDYAVGLPTPYGPGGSFTVTLAIGPTINDSIDCRTVRCAIVTRNDHTRGSDRSQDLILPVTFAADGPPPTAPVTTAPAASRTAPPDAETTSTEATVLAGPPDPTGASTTTTEAPTGTALVADEDRDGGGSGTALAVGGGVVVAGLVTALGVRARRRAVAAEPGA